MGEQASQDERFPIMGEFDLTLDEKNRLLIPADVRNQLDPKRDGPGFVVKIGPGPRLLLYPEKAYQAFLREVRTGLAPDAQTRRFNQTHFGLAKPVPVDKSGRVLLPDAFLQRTGTKRDITLVGAVDHLEIWNRDDWAQQVDAILKDLKETQHNPDITAGETSDQ